MIFRKVLREAKRVLTSAPWIFAAPTGADKVTVYWDPVPNATGYRVRWGTASGMYPNVSSVQPADARMLSITGLTPEQEYYFVVEAERNGVWSAPSDEDSAIPHVGAIPWDSGDAATIITRVRQVVGAAAAYGMFDVISPDEQVYSDYGVRQPDTYFVPETFSLFMPNSGFEIPLSNTSSDALENTYTGPYRRVKSAGGFIGVQGNFWAPSTYSPTYPYTQIQITSKAESTGAMDTPCMYFGYSVGKYDIEAGIMYHPSGRLGVNYPRWQAYFVTREGKSRSRVALHDAFKQNAHIMDSLAGGNEVVVQLILFPRDKLAKLRVTPTDPFVGELFIREIAGTTKVASSANGIFRRVHSVAQRKEAVDALPWTRAQGYVRTGSYVRGMGIGFNVIEGGWLDPPAQLQDNILHLWNDWTSDVTIQQGSFPASGVVSWEVLSPYSREIVNITLPSGD